VQKTVAEEGVLDLEGDIERCELTILGERVSYLVDKKRGNLPEDHAQQFQVGKSQSRSQEAPFPKEVPEKGYFSHGKGSISF
jgi:hypothetical protein